MSQLMQTFAALRETKDYTGIIEIIPLRQVFRGAV